MKLPELKIDTLGGSPIAIHNLRCPTCLVRHAVMYTDGGGRQPCWACQSLGFKIIRYCDLPWFIRPFVKNLFQENGKPPLFKEEPQND